MVAPQISTELASRFPWSVTLTTNFLTNPKSEKLSKIYEISAADGSDVAGGPITTSHYDGHLTGLARHPQKKEYATAGGDGTVRRCTMGCDRGVLVLWFNSGGHHQREVSLLQGPC